MITLVIEVGLLPDGILVRKVTGNKTYTIKRTIKIYGEVSDAGNKKEIICDHGTLFLMTDKSINCVPESMKVAIDFVETEDAIVFLESLEGGK